MNVDGFFESGSFLSLRSSFNAEVDDGLEGAESNRDDLSLSESDSELVFLSVFSTDAIFEDAGIESEEQGKLTKYKHAFADVPSTQPGGLLSDTRNKEIRGQTTFLEQEVIVAESSAGRASQRQRDLQL